MFDFEKQAFVDLIKINVVNGNSNKDNKRPGNFGRYK